MKGKIAYRFETPVYPGNIVYVNLIANYSCINDCLFCSRPRSKEDIGKPNIYEKKAESFLHLSKAPSIKEILKSIGLIIKDSDKEIAIIGLGEPLIYLPKVIEIIKKIKKKYNIKIRIDTNGLVKCMYKNPTEKLEKSGLDKIRISLNAINEKEYNKLCRPKFDNAFQNLISFIKECVNSKINTYVSFVIGFEAEGVKKRTKKEFKQFALSLGVKSENIIFRNYVKPIK